MAMTKLATKIRDICRYTVDSVLQQNIEGYTRIDIMNHAMAGREFNEDEAFFMGDRLYQIYIENNGNRK
jgi:hypothetical protein